MKRLKDYAREKAKWITTMESRFYPDGIDDALVLYGPILKRFGELLEEAADSADLLRRICREPMAGRIQLLRVFRKYVSPSTSVEMLKRKRDLEDIIANFGARFRGLPDVKRAFKGRPDKDEALAALLYEYADRGQKGYALTGPFFEWFKTEFEDDFEIEGPTGAGRDVILSKVLSGYEKRTPADFVIRDKNSGEVVAVGFARYDSDRGGAQEDDRTGSNEGKIAPIFEYNARMDRNVKVIFLNDGPGLLLGSMWLDYESLEAIDPKRVMVLTLKMLKDRLTKGWLRG